MKKIILFGFLLTVTLRGNGQSYADQQAQLAIYNIVFNGIVGGASEILNNPRHVKLLKAFAHGFRNGAIGGAAIVTGKYLDGIYAYHERLTNWPSRIITSLGTSIVYNIGFSNKFLQYYNFDAFGISMLRYDFINKKLCAKIMPAGSVGVVITAINSDKFNFRHTLQTGFPCFTTNTIISNPNVAFVLGSTRITSVNINHVTLPNGTFQKQDDENITLAHEIVHCNQYLEYTNLNNIFMSKIKSYKADKGMFKYIYIDFPYSDMAYELNDLIVGKNAPHYKNLFEFEAESYSTKQKVDRN